MTHSSSGAFSASNKASHTPFYASRRKRRHTEEGRGYVFVALDRTSKLAFTELQPRATKMLAADFLRRVLAAIPYKVHQVHQVLTDNGTQFGNMPEVV